MQGHRLVVIALFFGPIWAIPRSCPGQEHKSQGPAHYPKEMNARFADPNLSIPEFVQRFENDTRDVFVKRKAIVRAVGLHPKDTVADIGAGTGLFTHLFADEVGPGGTIYAADIGPAFLQHIAERAKQDGHAQIVKTVRNTQESAELPAGSIDVAFLCDTYHHFEHPGKMLDSIHRALQPEGRLVLIDFDLVEGCSDYVKQRARAPREVYFREIAAAGFEPVALENAPQLEDHFVAMFRRAALPPLP